MVRKFLAITLSLLGVVTARADIDFTCKYDKSSRTCVITGYVGQPRSRTLKIPLGIGYPGESNTYKVIGIESHALNGIAGIDTITIPNTIASIGWVDSPVDKVEQYCNINNFRNCPDLKYIKVDEGNPVFKSTGAGILTSRDGSQVHLVPPRIDVSAKGGELKMAASGVAIGANAFEGNSTIKKITFSKNLEFVSPDCGIPTMTVLEDIAIASGGTAGDVYQVDASALIRKKDKKLLFYPAAAPADIYIVTPMYVSIIGKYAFANTRKLEEIVVSEGVKVIEDYAFENSSVKDVWLGSTVDFVTGKGYGAFKNSKVETLTWKAKEKRSVPRDFMLGCRQLKKVECDLPFHSISSSAFRDCENLSEFNQFSFATYLVGDSIWANTGFEQVTFNDYTRENNSQSSAKALFAGCKKMKKIDLSKVLICDDLYRFTIWESFAAGCAALEEVWLPGFITLNPSSFAGCRRVKRVVMHQAEIAQGPVFTYNSDSPVHPTVYVRTPPNCGGSFESPIEKLFGNEGKGVVTPTFYFESQEWWAKGLVEPSENYIPGACEHRYPKATSTARIHTMFDFERLIGNTKVRFQFTTIPGVKIDEIWVDVYPDYEDRKMDSNVADFDIKYKDTESMSVFYEVNGIPYVAGYAQSQLPWNLTAVETGVEEVYADDSLHFDNGKLYGAAGGVTEVYTLSGVCLLRRMDAEIDLSGLERGVYIVRNGEKTVKIRIM